MTGNCIDSVRARGLEPPRDFSHGHLKPARLPIPPHPRSGAPSVGRAGLEPATV